MTKKRALLRIAAVIIITTASAETFDYSSRDGFRITIPTGWQAIPESKIQEMGAAIRKAAPTAAVPDFRYRYQAQSDRWFSYPYVLIWVKSSGRVPEHELQKLAKIDLSNITDKLRSSMGGLVSAFEVGKAAYDPATHIIWVNSEATFSGVGKVGILNGGVQTEEGAICVYGYAPRDTFESYKPTFIGITESVRPTEALRYKSRFSDSAPLAAVTDSVRAIDWSQVLVTGLAGGIIAPIIGIFLARRSRKNQKYHMRSGSYLEAMERRRLVSAFLAFALSVCILIWHGPSFPLLVVTAVAGLYATTKLFQARRRKRDPRSPFEQL